MGFHEHLDVAEVVVQHVCGRLAGGPSLVRRIDGLGIELGAAERAVGRSARFDRHRHTDPARRGAGDDLHRLHLNDRALRKASVVGRRRLGGCVSLVVTGRMGPRRTAEQLERVGEHRQ